MQNLPDYRATLASKAESLSDIDIRRMPEEWQRIGHAFTLSPIIHIVGTNGKGSTGYALEQGLRRQGVTCGLFTSPHILDLNERFYRNGAPLQDSILQAAHESLQILRPRADLSYFEYATLLAAKCWEKVEIPIMEAGLGGEYDATAVLGQQLSLITSIGMDHEAILGNTIEAIAATKLRSIRHEAILGRQRHEMVWEVAKAIADKSGVKLYEAEAFLNDAEKNHLQSWLKLKKYPKFQYNNFELALSALKWLGHKAEPECLEGLVISGRCQWIRGNIVIDVGHNPDAAERIVEEFSDRKWILVYNSYQDKNYRLVLEHLKPLVDRIQIPVIGGERIMDAAQLAKTASEMGMDAETIDVFQPDEKQNYLVFGSFKTVEFALKELRA